MIIGFTGTRYGMTDKQKSSLQSILSKLETITEVHHGDCIGADEEFDQLVKQSFTVPIIVHPPINISLRAFTTGSVIRESKKYLERDRDIVDECSMLIGAPKSFEPHNGSGTWYTIYYAVQVGKPVTIIFGNGDIANI